MSAPVYRCEACWGVVDTDGDPAHPRATQHTGLAGRPCRGSGQIVRVEDGIVVFASPLRAAVDRLRLDEADARSALRSARQALAAKA